MNNVRATLITATQNLIKTSPTPRMDAELLLMHVLNVPRGWLYAHDDATLTDEQLQSFNQSLQQRQQGIPIAYLTGHKEFWSMDLLVNNYTLIPRPETELLVERTLEKLANISNAHILELGTGTGAISLALAHEHPDWQIDAADISMEALELAKENAQRLKITNVTFTHSDWFSAFPALHHYDVVISNPPYIRETDTHLRTEDIRFEPRQALSSGKDGLDAIRHLIDQSPAYLRPNGWLLFEHGYDQTKDIHTLLKLHNYQRIQHWKDINGNDRVSGGQIIPK